MKPRLTVVLFLLIVALRMMPSPGHAFGRGFIENRGQFAGPVMFAAGMESGMVYVTADGLVFDLREDERRVALRVTIGGANFATAAGQEERRERYHYLLGKHPAGPAADVRAFDQVALEGEPAGEPVILAIEEGELCYRIEGGIARSSDVAIDVEGADRLDPLAGGGVACRTALGTLLHRPPDGADGTGAFRWIPRESSDPPVVLGGTFDFVLGTFLGGAGNESGPQLVALGASGVITVAGQTESADFPVTLGASDMTYSGNGDAFIAQFDSGAVALQWCTFLGGGGWDEATALAIGPAGEVIVAGFTESAGFPVTAAAGDTTLGGARDGFVTMLSTTGESVLWSRYLGGGALDEVRGMALGSGDVFLTGNTMSTDFPTTPGGFRSTAVGGGDAFVSRLSAAGGATIAGTYVGGVGADRGLAIALDPDGQPLVSGETLSAGFPTTSGAFDRTYNGGTDAFVLRLDPLLGVLGWSTLIGGTDWDQAAALDTDGGGNPIVTGFTWSTTFPTTAGAFDRSIGGGRDGFVVKLAADGSALQWSTFLGGNQNESCLCAAVDGLGNVVVTGETRSVNFPTTAGTFDSTPNGEWDAFVTRIRGTGDGLIWSSFVGGERVDAGTSVALDIAGNPVVAGWTASTSFPVVPGCYDSSPNGSGDLFVVKFSITSFTDVPGDAAALEPAATLAAAPNPFASGTVLRFYLDEAGNAGVSIYDVAGRPVRTFAPRFFGAGMNTFAWDGKDGAGRDAAPGIYLARVTSGSWSGEGKLLRIR